MFDRDYEHLGNKGTHCTRLRVMEGSDHPFNSMLNGKLWMLNDDDSDDDSTSAL